MRPMQRAWAVLAFGFLVGGVAVPAPATTEPPTPEQISQLKQQLPEQVKRNDLPFDLVVSGGVTVPKDKSVRSLVVVDGPVVVDGTVTGSVVSVRGPVTVSGSVKENVVSLNAPVMVRGGGKVGAQLVAPRGARVDPKATVGGEVFERWSDVSRIPGLSGVVAASVFGARLAAWLAFSVSTLVLGLLLGALFGSSRMDGLRTAADRKGLAAGIGLGLFVLLPVVAVLALGSVVGIPLGFGILLALPLLLTAGYTATAWLVGRRFLHPPKPGIAAFLVGWGILRLVALVPILGGLAWLGATVFGLGLIVVAARSGQRAPAAASLAAHPVVPVEPPVVTAEQPVDHDEPAPVYEPQADVYTPTARAPKPTGASPAGRGARQRPVRLPAKAPASPTPRRGRRASAESDAAWAAKRDEVIAQVLRSTRRGR